MDLKFEIDWGQGFVTVDPPRNWKGLQIEVVWTNDKPSASLNTTDLEWTGTTADKLNLYFENGLNGGKGIFEGPGLRVTACKSNLVVLDGVIDVANANTQWECDMVRAPVQEAGRIDWLNDIAASFSFAYLASLPANTPGFINPLTDYKKVPYVISTIPEYTQAALLSISIFIIVRELQDAITKFAQFISELNGNAATAAATLGTATPTLLATIARIVLYVTYIYIIITALIDLVKDLLKHIIQSKKIKLAMREQDLFIRGCQYLGLNFSSSIYGPNSKWKDATWMPQKQVMPSIGNPLNVFDRPEDESQNFPGNRAYGYFDGTFADFIVEMCLNYNAEVRIRNNTLYFEEKHAFNSTASFQMPNTGPVGFSHNYPAPFGTNAAELPSNYFITFALDQSELNTLHKFRGTNVQAIIQPASVYKQKNLLLKNLAEVRMNCARASRKEYLNNIELTINVILNTLASMVNFVVGIVNTIIGVLNAIINIFGGNNVTVQPIPPMPTNILNNRIGWLMLSNDSFSVPKKFIGIANGTEWNIHPQNETIMSAKQLFDDFHSKNLPTRGNQALVYTNKEFKFCCDDFLTVINNNIVRDANGVFGKMIRLVWDLHNERAINVDYKIFTNFTNNLTEKIIIDGRN